MAQKGLQKGLQSRVVAAAEEALERQKFVSPVDVCIGVGWLHSRHLDDWRQGRVESLESFLPVHAGRLAEIIEHLERWARAKDLTPSEGEYISATRDRRQLRFTRRARPADEQAWRTRWMSPELPAEQQERYPRRGHSHLPSSARAIPAVPRATTTGIAQLRMRLFPGSYIGRSEATAG